MYLSCLFYCCFRLHRSVLSRLAVINHFLFSLQLTIPNGRLSCFPSNGHHSWWLHLRLTFGQFPSLQIAVARACFPLWMHIERQHIPYRIQPYTRSRSKNRKKNGTEMSGCIGNGGRLCCFIFPTILCVPLWLGARLLPFSSSLFVVFLLSSLISCLPLSSLHSLSLSLLAPLSPLLLSFRSLVELYWGTRLHHIDKKD